jgi:hypothetical protein
MTDNAPLRFPLPRFAYLIGDINIYSTNTWAEDSPTNIK